MDLDWPLMTNNVTRKDLDEVIEFLKGDHILTQSSNVRAFEDEWSKWLGTKYSVFVNSGSSANLLTITALKYLYGLGEIIVPPLTWVSDIAALIQCGFDPVFVDINPDTLGMDENQVIASLTDKTKAVFITHVLGHNALSDRLIEVLKERDILLIEDVCESHGTTHKGINAGTFGLASNFSFYFAHHMSTIEGGMVCTDDEEFYQTVRMLRSHGMVRESSSEKIRNSYIEAHPDLNAKFIFAYPAYNMRSTELNAVIGRSQLKNLDKNNEIRKRNYALFLRKLDSEKYKTDFFLEGGCNYALVLLIKKPDPVFCEKVIKALDEHNVEFRRGTAGGGNQLRQPYLKGIVEDGAHEKLPVVEHVHFYGFYLGNYPDLPETKIEKFFQLLNEID